jgi:hypothetical protein
LFEVVYDRSVGAESGQGVLVLVVDLKGIIPLSSSQVAAECCAKSVVSFSAIQEVVAILPAGQKVISYIAIEIRAGLIRPNEIIAITRMNSLSLCKDGIVVSRSNYGPDIKRLAAVKPQKDTWVRSVSAVLESRASPAALAASLLTQRFYHAEHDPERSAHRPHPRIQRD